MYDKAGQVLRIETTSNDVSFFKHYRKVEHRDGTSEMKNAPLKKSIYSLSALRGLMYDANRRYLVFLSDLEDPSAGLKHLQQLSRPVREGRHSYRGFNLFDAADLSLLETLLNGAFNTCAELVEASADCATAICAACCREKPPHRFHACSNACSLTNLSRKPATLTNIT